MWNGNSVGIDHDCVGGDWDSPGECAGTAVHGGGNSLEAACVGDSVQVERGGVYVGGKAAIAPCGCKFFW